MIEPKGEGKGRCFHIAAASLLRIAGCNDTAITAQDADVRLAGDVPGAQTPYLIPTHPEAHRGSAKRRLKSSTESGAIPLYSDDQAMGGMSAEEMELDLIEGVDEEGNKVLLEVVRYFFYNGEEYVVLGDAQQDGGCEEGCDHCSHQHGDEDEEEAVNLYIMKVVESEADGEEMEEFVPVEDEDLLEKLIEVVQADFDNEESLDD